MKHMIPCKVAGLPCHVYVEHEAEALPPGTYEGALIIPEPHVSRCVTCKEAFKEGDMIQAFLKCNADSEGSWTTPVEVDAMYQKRHAVNEGVDGSTKIKRKHEHCKSRLKGRYDGRPIGD